MAGSVLWKGDGGHTIQTPDKAATSRPRTHIHFHIFFGCPASSSFMAVKIYWPSVTIANVRAVATNCGNMLHTRPDKLFRFSSHMLHATCPMLSLEKDLYANRTSG